MTTPKDPQQQIDAENTRTRSPEEIRFREDLADHIEKVRRHLRVFLRELEHRVLNHDRSKRDPEELDGFVAAGFLTTGASLLSPEYQEAKVRLGAALDHHYQHNRHHPEHFEAGAEGMNLCDLAEMIADWKAANSRPGATPWPEAFAFLCTRYHIGPQLARILWNSAELIGAP